MPIPQDRIIGDAKPDELALNQMRFRAGRWAAYQNHDLGHPQCGHLKFLQFGAPTNTYPTAEKLPISYPHDSVSQGHIYRLSGEVDLGTGNILPIV